ncbi:MAG: hypothetical protein NTZ74_14555 [Chloroflexi bacterium]|nr:hypothetical protein [Chloroflexota bacterium]
MRYYYVKDFQYDPGREKLEMLNGYYTDAKHNLFFPAEEITRDDALGKIRAGEFLFLHDGCYRQIKIRIAKINGVDFLRIDPHPVGRDDLG